MHSDYFSEEELLGILEKQELTYKKEEEILSIKVVVREYYITEDIRWFADRKLWESWQASDIKGKQQNIKKGRQRLKDGTSCVP